MPQDPKKLRPKPSPQASGPETDDPVQLRTEGGDYLVTESGDFLVRD